MSCDPEFLCRHREDARSIRASPRSGAIRGEEPNAAQAGLNRQIRISQLTSTLASGRRVPCGDSLIGHPNREASPLDQSRVVFRPVLHFVLRLRYLVAAGLVEFVGHGVSPT